MFFIHITKGNGYLASLFFVILYMRNIFCYPLVFFILLFSCKEKEAKRFVKIPSTSTGITFENKLENSPEHNILTYLYYYNGAGVAAADFNNDNLIDIYFTANQGPDKLYLNKGGFKFEDVTEKAKIKNSGDWTTGVTHVDINNDGLLDIYVCKVGNYKHIKGQNLLFVNQGIDKNGIPIFKEAAAAYGLDFSGFSTQVAFFDYDLDGDLDMYLLNHSVHPNRTYGKGSQRMEVDSLSGDRIYKNQNGKFVDASAETGIFQGKIGYGLGLGISDVNNDGYPDIYIGNDFFENDYLYINQKDGTFKEVISVDDSKLGHTSHFSMGNDLADINNDGYTDIISVDMLPEDIETYKTSGLEYAYPTYQYYLKNGYRPQYMQNTLHLNLGNGSFSEIAALSGLSATEWSWGPLFADYDNDGHKDVFVSNGIKGATNDMDFINFIANEKIQKRINQGMSKEDMTFVDELPEKKVPNYFFKNNGDLTFTDVTKDWFQKENSFSNGSTYADLDNDGDLDIIVNNVNEKAYVLENKSNNDKNNHYLKLDFKGTKTNNLGIGAKVIAYTSDSKIVQENYNSRGYLSSVPPSIHMGIGKDSIIDSIQVIWPGGRYQRMKSVRANQSITLDIKNANGNHYQEQNVEPRNYLTVIDSVLNFYHKDLSTIEFNRDPLVPFVATNEGPDISVADINKDSLDDIFISGAKRQSSVLLMQDKSGSFLSVQEDLFEKDAVNEDTSHIFFDANGDETLDMLVTSGGNEYKNGKQLQPRLYINRNGVFQKDENQFKSIAVNASKVDAVDFDNDGDIDVTISSDQKPWQFGITPQQYLFENDGKGNFIDVTMKISRAFQNIGNVKDFVWTDIDGNGFKDLIAVGNWMAISIFMNNGNNLKLQKNNGLDDTNGWWNALVAEDFDNDGDVDLVAGNWGTNSKFTASKNKPVQLYSYDFDNNGSVEPLVTFFYKETETPFASKDELVKQMPYLNKKYLSYQDFSKASIKALFSEEKLNKSVRKKAYELRSSYYENDGGGNFKRKLLPAIAQSSTIHDIATDDFDNDGFMDMLIVGNTHEISTQLGRMDAMHGLILRNDKEGGFQWAAEQNFDIKGAARTIKKISINGIPHFIIGINNSSPVILRKD